MQLPCRSPDGPGLKSWNLELQVNLEVGTIVSKFPQPLTSLRILGASHHFSPSTRQPTAVAVHAPYLAMLAPMHVNLAIIMSLGAASTTAAAAPRLPQRHCMAFSVRLTGSTRTASGGVFDKRSGTLVRTSRPSPHVLWSSLAWRVRVCASMLRRGYGQPPAACFKACMLCAAVQSVLKVHAVIGQVET